MAFPKVAFSVTFADTTPESASQGDYSAIGFLHEEWTADDFSELVRFVDRQCFVYWSSSGTPTVHDYLTSTPEVVDYTEGRERELSIHPKNERALRYLLKACKHLNIK